MEGRVGRPGSMSKVFIWTAQDQALGWQGCTPSFSTLAFH